MTLLAERPADEVDESELVVGRRIQEFSQLAGPIRELDGDGSDYRVSYRGVEAVHGRGRVWRSLAVAALNFAFEALFFLWLLHPSHRPPVTGPVIAQYANWVVIGSIGLMELLRLINVFSLSLASVISRDPVPVPPQPNQRIAFLTTIVPSKEPIDVVRGTLQAALRIRYQGILDVWILDEGDDPAVRAMCRELGVNHFTRKGTEKYNRKKGPFKAKTKHGNYNAWVAEHGDSYEIFLSVDPDHVPLPNYAERILGYFRDPDVSFVVGPQCYANDETFVTRAAESQQFPFHSLIQRAANRYNAAMLVGTNNAIRISALKGIGGLSDSVTEDMATGLKFHTRRNPQSGARWKSVYTPDVLAVGEGPSSWGDFFSQQMRWSRGTFEVLLTEFWRRLPLLSPGRALHYCLITTFYPSMAIGWILGAVNAVLFLSLGVQGVVVPVQLWLALYIDATAFQLWVYLRNRRYNVSPYEAEGSSGVKGMLMSIYASPIFAASLIATLLRLPARFVVTPKGLSSTADHVLTFRRHLQWALVLVAAIVASIVMGYAAPAVLLWPVVALCACLAPPTLWIIERVVGRQPVLTAEGPRTATGRTGITTESLQRAALDALIAQGPDSAPFRSPIADRLPDGWVRSGVPATVGVGVGAGSVEAPTSAVRAEGPAGPRPRDLTSGDRYQPLPRGWIRDGEQAAETEVRRVDAPSPGPRPNGLRPRPVPSPGEPQPRPAGGPPTGAPVPPPTVAGNGHALPAAQGGPGRPATPRPGPGQPGVGPHQSAPGQPGPGQPGPGKPGPAQPGAQPAAASGPGAAAPAASGPGASGPGTGGPRPSAGPRPSPSPRPGPTPADPSRTQAPSPAADRPAADVRPGDQPAEGGRPTPGPRRLSRPLRPAADGGRPENGADAPRPAESGPRGENARPAAGPHPGGPAPRPEARPRPRPTGADAAPAAAQAGTPSEPRPEQAARTTAVHRNEIAPLERRSRTAANGRPTPEPAAAQDGAAATGTNGTGSEDAAAPASPATGTPTGRPSPAARPRPAPAEPADEGDGMSTAERSLHASTVAVRVVALAAVAPAVAAARSEDAARRTREPEQTEAS
jgi:cellulose synthase/poly-beta-1,6-N-acetylglucosamine synthase-like glycosyltransferase